MYICNHIFIFSPSFLYYVFIHVDFIESLQSYLFLRLFAKESFRGLITPQLEKEQYSFILLHCKVEFCHEKLHSEFHSLHQLD